MRWASPMPSASPSTCTATASSRRFAPISPCWIAIPETLRRLSYRHVSFPRHGLWRSEEHTSELQSLMRISYAVFCLKKIYNIPPADSSVRRTVTSYQDNKEHNTQH